MASGRILLTMTEKSAISIEGLGKRYGAGPLILKNISMRVGAGEILTLVGPSGCGKSTFLRLIAGLIDPSEGRIRHTSSALNGPAFIFQEPTLLPWASALENIVLPLRLQGTPLEEQLHRGRHWLRRLGMEGKADALPHQLSGGMRMRVSIARALATNPSLLLLDEPFGALDALSRNQLNDVLLELHREQKWTALFVTHSVSEAVFLGHRIAVFSNGGDHVDLLDNPLQTPRTPATRSSSEFHALVAKVTNNLQKILPDETC